MWYMVFLFFCILLQMTGHKRILSIVYARWPVVRSGIIEKGHLIGGNMAARVMKGHIIKPMHVK